MRIISRIALFTLAGTLLGCDSPALPYREQSGRVIAPVDVHFYVSNNSQTQPSTDLRITWDSTVVAQDTFQYTNISDTFKYYSLSAAAGLHRLTVTNRTNGLVRDTVLVADTLTHIFISFGYTKLSTAERKRIHDMHPPEGDSAVTMALSEPKQLVIHVMRGPISIP